MGDHHLVGYPRMADPQMNNLKLAVTSSRLFPYHIDPATSDGSSYLSASP